MSYSYFLKSAFSFMSRDAVMTVSTCIRIFGDWGVLFLFNLFPRTEDRWLFSQTTASVSGDRNI